MQTLQSENFGSLSIMSFLPNLSVIPIQAVLIGREDRIRLLAILIQFFSVNADMVQRSMIKGFLGFKNGMSGYFRILLLLIDLRR